MTVTRVCSCVTPIEEKMMALKEQKLKLYKALLEDAANAGGAALSKRGAVDSVCSRLFNLSNTQLNGR
ncbi:MAG: hypothetical protein M0C28_21205, partial [Candidatus Moduliflexus flocculans]|nr:hypothetical protein [Candidatus Moduliflexus flocculans]